MNKKIKLIIFSHRLDRSGAPTSLLNIIKCLYEKNYKIDVISGKGGELTDEYKKFSNSLSILDDNNTSSFYKFISFFRLLSMMRQLSPDVVLINTSVNLRAHIACYILRIPFIVYVRESEDMLKSKLGYVRKHSLKLASQIVSVSNYSSQWVSKYAKAKKINIIHNGINFHNNIHNKIENDKKYITIGIIGYMSKRKGVDYFVQIINKLNEISENYKFLVIGDFIDENEKNNFWGSINNFRDNISITGIVANVYIEIDKCDILVMTSREESLPRSIMESSSMGKPVVAFDIAGTKEMLPVNYNYLISPFVIDDFVDKLVELSEYNKRKEIGEENRKYIMENFTLSQTIVKIENILKEVVENAQMKVNL